MFFKVEVWCSYYLFGRLRLKKYAGKPWRRKFWRLRLITLPPGAFADAGTDNPRRFAPPPAHIPGNFFAVFGALSPAGPSRSTPAPGPYRVAPLNQPPLMFTFSQKLSVLKMLSMIVPGYGRTLLSMLLPPELYVKICVLF